MKNKIETEEGWLKEFREHEKDLTSIVMQFQGSTLDEWNYAVKSNKFEQIGAILQRTWENAPDKPWIHRIPGWGVLCDLCSEYVFGPTTQED